MALEIILGDLLAAPEKYIGHQCNCVTKGNGAGLAKALFACFPFANVYADREVPAKAGSYSLHGDGRIKRFVVNFYAQYHPGKPRGESDTSAQRLEWLIQALEKFVRDRSPTEIALPFGIGCGLAGGNWKDYHEALEKFSHDRGVVFKLYKL